jgi:hypothetical protein
MLRPWGVFRARAPAALITLPGAGCFILLRSNALKQHAFHSQRTDRGAHGTLASILRKCARHLGQNLKEEPPWCAPERKRLGSRYSSGRSPNWLKFKKGGEAGGGGRLGSVKSNPGAQYEISIDGIPRARQCPALLTV